MSASVPFPKSDGEDFRVQGEGELVGRQTEGNLYGAEGGFQSDAGCARQVAGKKTTSMNAVRGSFLAPRLCWACPTLAAVAVPPLSGRVVDQTGTLRSDDVASLTQTLKNFEVRKGSQIAVLIVP